MPADVFGTPDDKHLLVGLTGGDHVEVYDVSGPQAKLVKNIATGEGAHAFRALGDGRHVFVGNRVANTINKIDYTTLESVAQFKAPGGQTAWRSRPMASCCWCLRAGSKKSA
jgi:hypothetical protein